jgi:hypothetical protein
VDGMTSFDSAVCIALDLRVEIQIFVFKKHQQLEMLQTTRPYNADARGGVRSRMRTIYCSLGAAASYTCKRLR